MSPLPLGGFIFGEMLSSALNVDPWADFFAKFTA